MLAENIILVYVMCKCDVTMYDWCHDHFQTNIDIQCTTKVISNLYQLRYN